MPDLLAAQPASQPLAAPVAHQNASLRITPSDPVTPMLPTGPGLPILANQESPQNPYRPDSQMAARPVDVPELSFQQMRCIDLLVQGHTEVAIAAELKINRGTIYRWRMHHPLFGAELSRRRIDLWGAAADRFRGTMFSAIRTLRKHLRHEQAIVQFRAARALLTLACRGQFSPPNDPTDPNEYLNRFALARRKEIHNPDFMLDSATESERKSALATLLAKADCPLPPSGELEPPEQAQEKLLGQAGF